MFSPTTEVNERVGRPERPALKETLRRFLPRSKRPHRILGGALKGQKIVTSWHDYPAAIMGYSEAPLLAWFAQTVKPGQTWLDIGAHYGLTSIALCELVGSKGRVFAFEPMQTSAGCLTETRRLNGHRQLSILPMGLGATGTMEPRTLPVGRGMVDSTLARSSWEEMLLIANFDWLWPRLSGGESKIHGVKIDVQGMEFEVINGMIGALRDHKPKLALEFHKGVDRESLLATLVQCGYKMPGLAIEGRNPGPALKYEDNHSYIFTAG